MSEKVTLTRDELQELLANAAEQAARQVMEEQEEKREAALQEADAAGARKAAAWAEAIAHQPLVEFTPERDLSGSVNGQPYEFKAGETVQVQQVFIDHYRQHWEDEQRVEDLRRAMQARLQELQRQGG
jgi:hypothetical protein